MFTSKHIKCTEIVLFTIIEYQAISATPYPRLCLSHQLNVSIRPCLVTCSALLSDARSQHDIAGREDHPGLPLRLRPQHIHPHILCMHVSQRSPRMGIRRGLPLSSGTIPTAPSNTRIDTFCRRTRRHGRSSGICVDNRSTRCASV